MGKIIRLPYHLISRIAAGEVIERPVYAVKELIENAIDAHAENIEIVIEDSGLKRIIVTDDGEGMSPEDILESVKPHTTSKIHDESLEGLQTLGFRGEALSSIAAISTMTIQSRRKEDIGGYQLSIHNGEINNSGPVGVPFGTTVIVNNLFSSIPARKKFLKSKRTEFRHILDLVNRYSLTYPAVRYRLIHNKKIIYDLPKADSLEERLEKTLGKQVLENVIPLLVEEEYITMKGFLVKPQIYNRSTDKQYIFVNGRVVQDKTLSSVIKNAYGTAFTSVMYPIFVLHLQVPYEMVDVNVHPRKEQIKFFNSETLYRLVEDAVKKKLEESSITFSIRSTDFYSARRGSTTLYAAEQLREKTETWNVKDLTDLLNKSTISQLHDTYLVINTGKDIVLIDQHAAHERILYEQLSNEFETLKKQSKLLEKPIQLLLSRDEILKLEEYEELLTSLGFAFSQKKDKTYVTGIPEVFKDRDIEIVLRDLLGQIDESLTVNNDQLSEEMLKFLACRSAIMAGEKLTETEAQRLIEKLENTKSNTTCPHGRPTKIIISSLDLDMMFKRR